AISPCPAGVLILALCSAKIAICEDSTAAPAAILVLMTCSSRLVGVSPVSMETLLLAAVCVEKVLHNSMNRQEHCGSTNKALFSISDSPTNQLASKSLQL